ncbi:YbjN domain-containing protein, partial [Streptomyces sp. WAC06614]
VSWVRASIEFDKWLLEQLGLEQELEGEQGDDEGDAE